MTTIARSLLAASLSALALLQQGCLKDTCRRTYTLYKPIFQSLREVRAGMRSTAPRALENTGKLNVFGNTIFLNEVGKGIHIIDNSNPLAPKNTGFINIPGNLEIAVKGSVLYADSYSDVVAFDISSPAAIVPVKFLDNVVKEKNVYWQPGRTSLDSIKVVVDYEKKDTVVECATYNRLSSCVNCSGVLMQNAYAAAPTTGVGGSMAGLTIVNDYLYAVGASSLYSIRIADVRNPQPVSVKSVGWGIETIYPFQNKLFLGARTGMFIFDLADPANPKAQGSFSHAVFCDPVIADDTYAYVTLRGGTVCNTTTPSELNVIDVRNLMAPVLKQRYPLSNPYGLAKDGDLLFVCDGKEGLKLYDASSPLNLKLTKHLTGPETFDVIALNKRAIVVAKDGLYQYDYSDAPNLKFLSKLSITKK